MAKKVWYSIELISIRELDSNGERKTETIAKVKSKGLSNLVYNQFTELYKDNKDVLLHIS